MTVRGWLIVGNGVQGLPRETFQGGFMVLPNAAVYAPGHWIHWLDAGKVTVCVCIEVPL